MRGKVPDEVYRSKPSGAMYAMRYIEPGIHERWGITLWPQRDIEVSWSTMIEWLRPLIGDRVAIEVYPRDSEIINTAPTRWFWILPGNLPPEIDLNTIPNAHID